MTELKRGMLVQHVTGGPVMVVEGVDLVAASTIEGDGFRNLVAPMESFRVLSNEEQTAYINRQRDGVWTGK